MKKRITTFLSFLFTVLAVLSVCQVSFAETSTRYWEPRPNYQDTQGNVNSEIGGNIQVEPDEHTGGVKFTYADEGQLIGWEFPTATKNVDYKVISRSGNSIVIKVISDYGIPYINALVDFGGQSDVQSENSTENTTDNSLQTNSSVSQIQNNDGETTKDFFNSNTLMICCIAAAALLAVIGVILIIKSKK